MPATGKSGEPPKCCGIRQATLVDCSLTHWSLGSTRAHRGWQQADSAEKQSGLAEHSAAGPGRPS